MKRRDFARISALAAAGLAMLVVGGFDAQAQQAIKNGDVLTGQLNAMKGHAARGKRIASYQLVSEPHRLPPPNGLCGLETGPETFQIVTNSVSEAAELKPFIGKTVSVKANEMSCPQDAQQFSDAIVTKWSLVGKQ